MNIELIMKSDVLDILFDQRNKAYGAYTLRKFYSNRLIKAVGAMLIIVIFFTAFTFFGGKQSNPDEFPVTESSFAKILPPPKIADIKPKFRLVDMPKMSPLKSLANIIMVDKIDSAEILPEADNRTLANIVGVQTGTSIETGLWGGVGKDTSNEIVKPAEPPVDLAKPLNNPEIMPRYPGGMDALRKFLISNLRNPRDLEEGELISVKVMFVVGFDGKLQRFEIIEDGGREFNNEVLRVLKKMPAWIPGKSRGQNVPVFYAIPVKFVPED